MNGIVDFQVPGSALCCRFHGRMDGVTSQQVDNEVFERVAAHKGDTVFDLSGASYVSSAFLRLCVRAARAITGKKIEIVGLNPSMKEVFDMTGLGRIFNLSLRGGEALSELDIEGHLKIVKGPGDFPTAKIDNAFGSATVSLHGAHVMEYCPKGQEPVLWMSQKSYFAPGKSIRGGIPVCWPWFGPCADDPKKPSHGFVRFRDWEFRRSEVTPEGGTRLVLGMASNDQTMELWPHRFDVELEVVVGHSLEVSLHVKNLDDKSFTFTGALHSYFAVGDIAKTTVTGLSGRRCHDKLTDKFSTWDGPVKFASETDMVFLDTEDVCVITDPVKRRRISVAKRGSRSSVVWNPWVDKSIRMPDFGDDEFHGMVCVETCNAEDDIVTVAPGAKHVLTTLISSETIVPG